MSLFFPQLGYWWLGGGGFMAVIFQMFKPLGVYLASGVAGVSQPKLECVGAVHHFGVCESRRHRGEKSSHP